MNVDIVGKLQDSHCKDGIGSNFCIRPPNKVALNSNGPHIVFQKLYEEAASNADLFHGSISPLVDHCMAGYNVCLLVMGTKNSQKSFLIGGSSSSTGIVAYVFEYLFHRLNKGNTSLGPTSKSMARSVREPNVKIQMWELGHEMIKDLLVVTQNKQMSSYRQLVETPTSGVHIENCVTLNIQNMTDSMTKFRLGWSMRANNQSVWNDTSAFIQIQIHLNVGISSLQTDTKFTIVELPYLENLIDCQESSFGNYNIKQDKSLKFLKDIISTLANHPDFNHNVNYQCSKLPLMLKEQLGGNCHTCAVLSLDSGIKVDLFKEIQIFTRNLSRVVNFPVINDIWIQELLSQYRAQIINLKRQLDFFSGQRDTSVAVMDFNHPSQQKLQRENVLLQNSKDDLLARIDRLQGRYKTLQLSETDLSCQLLMTEEERLKLSESLIDYQIQIKEFKKSALVKECQLTDKIVEMEKTLHQTKEEKSLLLQQFDAIKYKLSVLERDNDILMKDHSKLKITHRNLKQLYEIEVKKNEELHVEVVNLVNYKSALKKELNSEYKESSQHNEKTHDQSTNDIIALNKIIADLKEKLVLEKDLFKNEIKTLRMQYAESLKNKRHDRLNEEADVLKTPVRKTKGDNFFSHAFNKHMQDKCAHLLSENQVLETEVSEMRRYINQLLERQRTKMKKKKKNSQTIVSNRKNIFPAIHSSLN